jgi:hypothetical protein
MNGRAYLVWQRMVGPNATEEGLESLERMLLANDPNLVRGEWGDDERGCILQHLGRHHPRCSGENPGKNFGFLYGGVQVIRAWDSGDITRRDLLRLVRLELRARRRARKAVASC